MKKFLLLILLAAALAEKPVQAQCPPGAFAYLSADLTCATGCSVLLLGWPEGSTVNIYGGAPLTIITSAQIPGIFGHGGVDNAYTCVPCNVPLVFASTSPNSTTGCVIATIGVVPVKISEFTTNVNGNNCQLRWTAVSETSPVKYSIQKSIDGKNFTDIGTLNGKQLPVNDYSFTDASAFKGTSYYRIKITELTGKAYFSDVAMLKNQSEFGFSVYPNPAIGAFTITMPSKFLPATVEVINAQGAVVSTAKTNQPSYTVSQYLQKGVYAVRVTGSNNESLTQRLIKN